MSRWSRESVVKGAVFGCQVVLATPRLRSETASVQCQSCGQKARVRIRALYKNRYLNATSCVKCKWSKVHRSSVPCSGCGVVVERPDFAVAKGGVKCDDCKRRTNAAADLRRRALALGRVCRTCGATDSQTRFASRTACVACDRAAFRNGRCECGRAIRRTRDCPCGVKAATTTAEVARHARKHAGPIERLADGRFAPKRPGRPKKTAPPRTSTPPPVARGKCKNACGADAATNRIHCSDRCRIQWADRRRRDRNRAARLQVREVPRHPSTDRRGREERPVLPQEDPLPALRPEPDRLTDATGAEFTRPRDRFGEPFRPD